jgi:hypothetical protein
MNYPEVSWTPNSKAAGEWGDLNIGGWMVWWKFEEFGDTKIVDGHQDRQPWKSC